MPQGNSGWGRRPLPQYSTWPSGDPRWQRRLPAAKGGPATSPPSVLTVGINGIGINSSTGLAFANVISSINPRTASNAPYGPINLVPNPSFEEDAVGAAPASWQPSILENNVGATLTCQSSAGAQSGSKAMRVVTTAALVSEGAEVSLPGTFLGGQPYTLSLYMKGNAGGEQIFPGLGVPGDLVQTGATLTTNWVQSTVSWTPSANRNNVTVFIQHSAASAVTFFIDAVQVTATSSAITYFDGDQTGYQWLGTAGNSASQQTGTWWWLYYGTQLPLPSGSQTQAQFLGFGTTPLTETITLTGLTVGQTYYIAAVAQNSGGTMIGGTIPFVAVPTLQPATQPVVPFGQPSVTIPHFNLPFTLVTSGSQQGAVVVEQDTLEEVFAAVTTAVQCPLGACKVFPNFGVPNMTFAQAPLDTSEMVAAIQEWEPRANADILSQLSADGTGGTLSIMISSAGTETT